MFCPVSFLVLSDLLQFGGAFFLNEFALNNSEFHRGIWGRKKKKKRDDLFNRKDKEGFFLSLRRGGGGGVDHGGC